MIDPVADPADVRSVARPGRPDRRAVLSGVILTAIFGLLAAGLIGLALVARNDPTGGFGASATAPPDPASFAYAEVRPAPPLRLTDQDGQPFDLAALRGRPVLVFFGYTHCPDVCPVTVGIVNEVLAAVGDGPQAVFTSIDPALTDPPLNHGSSAEPVREGVQPRPGPVARGRDAVGLRG